MTKEQYNYFEKMESGSSLQVSKARDSQALIKAGKEYIDMGGNARFSGDYSVFIKEDAPIPISRRIQILLNGQPI